MSLAPERSGAGAAYELADRPGAAFAPVAQSSSGARDLELLERAISVAVSPFDFADAIAWGDQLTSSLCALAGAIAGVILLPDGTHRWRAVNYNPVGDSHDAAWGTHEEATERLLREATSGDLVLWARDDLSEGGAERASPSGTIGIRVRTPNGRVAAVCVHSGHAHGPVPYHVLAALRAIAPAFRSGVAAWVDATACRSNVARMLDSLGDPALLFDVGGELLHANPAVGRLTQSVDAGRLRGEAQRIAWTMGATLRRRSPSKGGPRGSHVSTEPTLEAHTERALRIGAMVYRLRGSVIGEHLLGADPAVLVTITSAAAEPLSDDALHAMYGLTTREIQVARLIAEGLSNNEIAERLGVKFFTARNHVERTLAKLRVASRNRVGPMLRNDPEQAAA